VGVDSSGLRCWCWFLQLQQILYISLFSSWVDFPSQCCTSPSVIIRGGIEESIKLKASWMSLYVLRVMRPCRSLLMMTGSWFASSKALGTIARLAAKNPLFNNPTSPQES
jgi:hypothetical protein